MLLVLISAYSSSGHELLPTFWLGVITAIPRHPGRADDARGRAAGEAGLRFFGILPEDTREQLYRVHRPMPNWRRQFVAPHAGPAALLPVGGDSINQTVRSARCRPPAAGSSERSRPADGPGPHIHGPGAAKHPCRQQFRCGRPAGCASPKQSAPVRRPERIADNRHSCAAEYPAAS